MYWLSRVAWKRNQLGEQLLVVTERRSNTLLWLQEETRLVLGENAVQCSTVTNEWNPTV